MNTAWLGHILSKHYDNSTQFYFRWVSLHSVHVLWMKLSSVFRVRESNLDESLSTFHLPSHSHWLGQVHHPEQLMRTKETSVQSFRLMWGKGISSGFRCGADGCCIFLRLHMEPKMESSQKSKDKKWILFRFLNQASSEHFSLQESVCDLLLGQFGRSSLSLAATTTNLRWHTLTLSTDYFFYKCIFPLELLPHAVKHCVSVIFVSTYNKPCQDIST